MSRDQRPARPVMIDSGAASGNSQRGEIEPASESVSREAETAILKPRPSGVLISVLFLIACILGAAGVAFLQLLGTQQ